MFFKNSNGMSYNSNQDFMWVADYVDGNYLLEFDRYNKENSFYMIKKSQLLKFGLVGCGHKMYFNTMDGTFEISGRKIELQYVDENDNTYNLTGSGEFYNDILQYKEAESNFNPMDRGNKVKTNIQQFNFGYKQKLNINGVNFNLKVICKIPYNSPIYLEITLTSNKQLNGKLLIKRNNKIIDIINAPLKRNIKGMVNWDII